MESSGLPSTSVSWSPSRRIAAAGTSGTTAVTTTVAGSASSSTTADSALASDDANCAAFSCSICSVDSLDGKISSRGTTRRSPEAQNSKAVNMVIRSVTDTVVMLRCPVVG